MINSKNAKKFASFSLATIASAVLGIVSTVIFAAIFVPEELGKTMMFLTVSQVALMFAVLGLDQAFVRFFYDVPEEQRPALALTCMIRPTVVFSALAFGSIPIWKEISEFVFAFESAMYVGILMCYVFLAIGFRFAQNVLRMQHRGLAYSTVVVLQRVLSIVLTLVFVLFLGPRMEAIILGEFLSILLACVTSFIFSYDFWKRAGVPGPAIDADAILRYSLPLVLTVILSALTKSLDKVLIRSFSSLEDLGIYSVAFRISLAITVVQSAFTTFWVPLAQERFSTAPEDRSLYVRMHDLLLMVLSLLALGLIAGRELIFFVVSESYRSAIYVFPLLCMQPLFYTLTETTSMGISFMRKTKHNLFAAVLSLLGLVISGLLLIPPLGAVGGAFSVAISFMLYFTYKTIASERLFHVPIHYIRTFLVAGMLMILASLASMRGAELAVEVLCGVLLTVGLFFFRSELRSLGKVFGLMHK